MHFVKALLSEGRAEEALEFVRETYARSNEARIGEYLSA